MCEEEEDEEVEVEVELESDNVKDEDEKEQGSSANEDRLAGSKVSSWVHGCCSVPVTVVFAGGDVTMSMSAKKTEKEKQICTTKE